MRRHQPTRNYLARRLAEGKTKNESMRCLKRYIAREIYRALQTTPEHRSAPAIDLGVSGIWCKCPTRRVCAWRGRSMTTETIAAVTITAEVNDDVQMVSSPPPREISNRPAATCRPRTSRPNRRRANLTHFKRRIAAPTQSAVAGLRDTAGRLRESASIDSLTSSIQCAPSTR